MDSCSSTDSSCHVCKKKFKNPENLSLHLRFHSLFGNFKKASVVSESNGDEGTDGSVASSPGKQSSQENSTSKNESVLLVEKPFRCSKCGANFSSMRNKMQHDLLHAKRTSGFEQRGTYTNELKCSICKKRCRTENGLQKHFESEHTGHVDPQGIQCEKSSSKPTTESTRDSNLEKEHANATIQESSQSIPLSDNSNKDRKKRHKVSRWADYEMVLKPKKGSKGLQMYQCKLCKANCFTMRSIQKHLKRDHRHERRVPTSCDKCNRIFADEGALRRHITMQHKTEKDTPVETKRSTPVVKDNVKEAKRSEVVAKPASKTPKGGDAVDEEKFHCQSCSLKFPTVAKMCKHLRESHSQRQMQLFLQMVRGYRKFRIYSTKSAECKYGFQCVNCKKRANSLKVIMEHLSKEHTLEAEFQNGVSFSPSWSRATGRLGTSTHAGAKSGTADTNSEKSALPMEEGTPSEASNEVATEKAAMRRKKNFKRFKYSTRKVKRRVSDSCHCFDCGVELKTEWALEEHYKNRHSGTNFQMVPKFSIVKGKYNLLLKCLICGQMCRSKGSLKQHLKNHNRDLMQKNLMPNSSAVIDKEEGSQSKDIESKGEKRKRNTSCIYHCRVCGESFPRLFSYSEHHCTANGKAEVKEKMEKKTEGEGDEVFSDPELSVGSKRARFDSSQKLGKDKERSSSIDKSKEAPQGDPVTPSKVTSNLREKPGKQVRKEAVLNRSPWSAQKSARDTSLSSMENNTRKVSMDSMLLCGFCKRPFSNQKHLSRHERLHSEGKLISCSNCGMAFTGMHTLKQHSTHCMRNKHAAQRTGVRKSASESFQEFNGRVDGNTYPSYASKSEYTYVSRPYELTYLSNDPSLDEEMNTAKATESSTVNSRSSLDSIVIADVRSCNPAFSNEKVYPTATNRELVPNGSAPSRDKNNLVPGELVPGYYLDGVQIPYVPVDGITPPNGTLNVQQPGCLVQNASPNGMYTQGTVFLVPYFVPSQGVLSKDRRLLSAPKPGLLPPGGFLMNPSEFGARFGSTSDESINTFSSGIPKSQAIPLERHHNTTQVHGDRHALKCNETIRKVNTGNEKRNKYECSVCNRSFLTFGNYIKHREVHRV